MHSVNQKTLKGKKKKKSTCTAKKNHIEKFETQNLKRCTAALVLVEDTEVINKKKKAKHRCKSVDKDVIKFKSIKYKNR